MLTVYQSIN